MATAIAAAPSQVSSSPLPSSRRRRWAPWQRSPSPLPGGRRQRGLGFQSDQQDEPWFAAASNASCPEQPRSTWSGGASGSGTGGRGKARPCVTLGDRSEAASSLESYLAASAPSVAAPHRAPSVMKGGKQYGAFGALTLEKAKLDLSQHRKKIMPELVTGGGGGDIGKRIGHGGGDGGDDDADDDDYFDDFDDGEEEGGGLFRRRLVIRELFNREFIDAILQEWCKMMSNLPAGLRQAYEMIHKRKRSVKISCKLAYKKILDRYLNCHCYKLVRGVVAETLMPQFVDMI